MTARHVLVAVPCRDEEEALQQCLAAIVEALRCALAVHAISSACVAVSAHRCRDGTAGLARRVLATSPDVDSLVIEEPADLTVGEVRSRLVRQARRTWPEHPAEQTWLFSSDADSAVPASWVTALLAGATRAKATMVLGMVDVVDWIAEPAARAEYERIITSGLTADGHRHVYAANLAVRLDVYQRAGGFPALPHGEEHGLVSAARAQGARILTMRAPRVRTSGRMPGRAIDGLGDLLGQLAGDRASDPAIVKIESLRIEHLDKEPLLNRP